jgi:hypothetical protein
MEIAAFACEQRVADATDAQLSPVSSSIDAINAAAAAHAASKV